MGSDGAILHDVDGLWQTLSPATPGKDSLYAVAMRSPNDGWAVGDSITHYSAGTWQTLKTRPRGVLTALALVGTDEVWAGDSVLQGKDAQGISVTQALLMHYTQGQWVEVPI